jgi:transcriptional regulator of acetoin/glycerol metabolism
LPQKKISRKALQYLEDYQWEGNIRELENFIKYILSTVDNDSVGVSEIPDHFKQKDSQNTFAVNAISVPEEPVFAEKPLDKHPPGSPFEGYTWKELEKEYVMYLLDKNRWNITRAAKTAEVNRSTFCSRMKKLGINNI